MSTSSKSASTILMAAATGLTCTALLVLVALFMSPREAAATQAIAQKTGQPCGKCHSTPPALNSYGKSYKAKAK
jgi:hypothetical protein